MANYTKAFTLVELLVAMTIIMVLTIVAVVNYGSVQKNARDSKRKADLEKVRVALEMYRQDHDGCYPVSPSTTLVSEGYLDVFPIDPFGYAYWYDAGAGSASCQVVNDVLSYTWYAKMESSKNDMSGVSQNVTAECDKCPFTATYKVTNP